MPRRQRQLEEHENHERWLISYADFITLMFALFVVMYSVSTVNDGKYRVLSDSLEEVFADSAQLVDPIQVGAPVAAPVVAEGGGDAASANLGEELRGMAALQEAALDGLAQETDSEGGPADFQAVAGRVMDQIMPLLDDELVDVRETEEGVEVELKSKLLFQSGNARLGNKAIPILEKVATMLNEFDNSIRVEGYTDNVPIATATFPSNWGLSAARAASVVHLFTKLEVRPERLSAVGHGEFTPIADNGTESGREENRRVVIVIRRDSVGATGSVPAPSAMQSDSQGGLELLRETALPGRAGPKL